MKTYIARPSDIDKKWLLIDAKDLVLGRLSVVIANYVRGKHKPSYTPSMDCGDNVVVINAEKIKFSGDKMNQKEYVSHTGYPGGRKTILAKDLLEKHPTRLIEKAVKGMLPKNKLGRSIKKNLYVYTGETHEQVAQKPELINLDDIK